MTSRDAFAASLLVVLGLLAVSLGQKAHSSLAPRSAVKNARVISDLELPARLPDAPIRDDAGVTTTLLERMKQPRAAIAFYAPWCGPCQDELRALSRLLGKSAELFVVVGADEDLEHSKRQLANIGLGEIPVYVDFTEALTKEGRVTVLPTTFAITKRGAVLARTKGYSFGAMYQLAKKVRGTGEDGDE